MSTARIALTIKLLRLKPFAFLYFFIFFSQWRVLTAPFHPVAFADFWLADQLNSLVVAILDMEYMSCFYALDYYSVQGKLNIIGATSFFFGLQSGFVGI